MTAPVSTALPAWSDRLIAALDEADRNAREVLAGLTAEELNRQPQPGSWSVGQCLEHLCITNEIYLPAISTSLRSKQTSPVQEIRLGWFGRWFINNFIEPSPQTRRAPAPKKIVPAAHIEPSVLDRFVRSNQGVRELIQHAREYDVNSIRFRNPFVPLIRFTVGTGLEVITRHERRHLLQAQRARASFRS